MRFHFANFFSLGRDIPFAPAIASLLHAGAIRFIPAVRAEPLPPQHGYSSTPSPQPSFFFRLVSVPPSSSLSRGTVPFLRCVCLPVALFRLSFDIKNSRRRNYSTPILSFGLLVDTFPISCAWAFLGICSAFRESFAPLRSPSRFVVEEYDGFSLLISSPFTPRTTYYVLSPVLRSNLGYIFC